MYCVNICDNSDNTQMGVIVFKDTVQIDKIQSKIDDIKSQYNSAGYDWYISDIIGKLPSDWIIHVEYRVKSVFI